MAVVHPHRIELARLPTPLVPLERLSRELGGVVWVKRDDLTGLELSGNKVRKLEYVLAEALRDGCDAIVTEGTSQSNHCRATAAACARLGLHCTLLLRPEPAGLPTGNWLLDELFGAECRGFPRPYFDDNREAIVSGVLDELRRAGRRPRYIPTGASEPLGCWGYIRAAAELAEQTHRAGLGACDLVTAVSSCGTYAGLLLGKLLHRLDHWHVWGVPVSDDAATLGRQISQLCRDTIERYGLPRAWNDSALALIDGYVGPGYAVPYGQAMAALRLLARTEGIVLDPVYTAKAFCALVDAVRGGRFGHRRPVVFIHTGGIFSDFAWPQLFADARS